MGQKKHNEWHEQWSMMQDEELFLLEDWIKPYTLEDFRGKDILECGCGGGQHTNFIAKHAKTVTAVDLNTVDIAKKRNIHNNNVTFVEDDIATMDLGKKFDIVVSIGVVHHTDNPENTVQNMQKHLKKGGCLIVWVYSVEGNWMVKNILEPIRKAFLVNRSRTELLKLARFITACMYPIVYSIYFLPLSFFPYYYYFKNFRKLSFERNMLNVFDKLNAPQTDFINYERAQAFVKDMEQPHVGSYKGVSWRISGVNKT